MSRQWIKTVLMGGLLAFSALAFAAREEHRFEVSVIIPTLGFYVIPAEAGWIQRDQVLPWNGQTSTLGSFRKLFDVRHDSSAIEARLEGVPYLSNGDADNNIYLRVHFNGTQLIPGAAAVPVVPAREAMLGSRVPLLIEPRMPAGGYVPGQYYGNVLLVFSAAAP
jgi:hypothetical protein